jgi:phosphatidylserine/phosphatidylglycerophosphate/cardiolipin synthase-like enzyme
VGDVVFVVRARLGPGRVYFFSHCGCITAIVQRLNEAKAEILIQAYSFTSRPIARALIAAAAARR